MRRLMTGIIIGLAVTATALAADDILRLKSGKFVVGEIVKIDRAGVTLKSKSGEARYDWSSLTPLSVYEVRADRLDPSDANGHVALAEFCLGNGLYPYARRELNTARGLDHPNAERLDLLTKAVDQAEADEAYARIEQLMAEEEYEKALEEASRFIRQAPKSEHTDRARALAADILRRKDTLALRLEEEQKEAARLGKENALNDRLAKLLRQVEAHRKAAGISYAEGVKNHELGKVSRAAKGYLAAEKSMLQAVKGLGKVQRLARRGVTFEKAEAEKDLLKKKLVEVYLGLARLKIDHRNFKGGIPYVNKALYLDPVNKEALDLRKIVDEQRIRRSARKITNTPATRTK